MPTEIDRVRESSSFQFLGTQSNEFNQIHHFEVMGAPIYVLLHEQVETGKLFAVWSDPSKLTSPDGRYVPLHAIFESLPAEVQREIFRLRPLLSRARGTTGDEVDRLDELRPIPRAKPIGCGINFDSWGSLHGSENQEGREQHLECGALSPLCPREEPETQRAKCRKETTTQPLHASDEMRLTKR